MNKFLTNMRRCATLRRSATVSDKVSHGSRP